MWRVLSDLIPWTGLHTYIVLLANTREKQKYTVWQKTWIIMRLHYKYVSNLPLYTLNCHVFSSREENIIKVNSTGGLCCILASHPLFFIWYLCAKSRQSCQQLPPTQNPQDFPSLIQNCNQLWSPGQSWGVASWVLGCSVDGNKLLCCLPTCQARSIREGKVENEPVLIARTLTWLQHMGATVRRDSMRNIPANALTHDTQLHYHTDLRCISTFLEPHRLCKQSTQHTEGWIRW